MIDIHFVFVVEYAKGTISQEEQKMKKITAILLAMLMLFSVTASGLSVFAAVDVSVECTDTNPISITDVKNTKFTSAYFLHESEIDYEIMVTMPDGTKQELNPDVNAAGTGRYKNYGYAYVDFEECEIAVLNGSTTVPVHIYVEVNETVSGEKHGSYDFVIYKKLVNTYIKSITPVDGIPNFIYELSEAVNFNIAKFEVEYWNGRKATYSAVKTDEIDDKPAYTLNGAPLRYAINRYDSKIFVSYIDGSCTLGVSDVKEFPFLSIKITDCKLKGDMPEIIEYTIKWRNGRTESYTANVNSYSGNMNYMEGYNISFLTEGSRFVSTVTVSVGDLKDSRSFEIEQQSFFARIIAKILFFLNKMFNAAFPGKD